MAYFDDIKSGIKTTLNGLSLTLRHLRQATQSRTPMGIAADNYFDQQTGIVTLQYPHEQFPIPDNGRYRLHNEMDDCIVCDKCAKVCPVDCITIDPIKATGEVGRASDGSPIRLYAETFDIDMAKCCYCGLCTVVCPTECLTMEKTFDFSEYELGKLTYHFANLTPEQATEKRTLYEQFVLEKEALKAQQAAAKIPTPLADDSAVVPKPKPAFRPTAKPAAPKPADELTSVETSAESAPKPKPAFRPTLKPAPPKAISAADELPPSTPAEAAVGLVSEEPAVEPAAPKPRPVFRPTLKPTPPKPVEKENETEDSLLNPLTNPTFDEAEQVAMAGLPAPAQVTEPEKGDGLAELTRAKKPAFRPTMKPKGPAQSDGPLPD